MGRLRGKRNRDQDRYWTTQRRAEQSGMVGADVPLCVFCGDFVLSDEVGYTDPAELFCRKCGEERGLIQVVRVNSSDTMTTLASVDMLSHPDAGPRVILDARSGILPERSLSEIREAAVARAIEREERRRVRRRDRVVRVLRAAIEQGIQTEQHRRDRVYVSIVRSVERHIDQGIEREQRRRDRVYVSLSRAVERQIEQGIEREQHRRDRVYVSLVRSVECQIDRGIEREQRGAALLARRMASQCRYKEQHPNLPRPRSLTNAQIETIRQRYATGAESFQRLGCEFAVTGATINQIVVGATYRDVGGPIHTPRGDRTWMLVRDCLERSRAIDAVA